MVVLTISGNLYLWFCIKERYKVEIRPCDKTDIMEIDNYYELAQLDSSYQEIPK